MLFQLAVCLWVLPPFLNVIYLLDITLFCCDGILPPSPAAPRLFVQQNLWCGCRILPPSPAASNTCELSLSQPFAFSTSGLLVGSTTISQRHLSSWHHSVLLWRHPPSLSCRTQTFRSTKSLVWMPHPPSLPCGIQPTGRANIDKASSLPPLPCPRTSFLLQLNYSTIWLLVFNIYTHLATFMRESHLDPIQPATTDRHFRSHSRLWKAKGQSDSTREPGGRWCEASLMWLGSRKTMSPQKWKQWTLHLANQARKEAFGC